MAKKKTKKKTAKRKAPAKARSRARRTTVSLHQASPATRLKVVADIHRVFARHGVKGQMAALHLMPPPATDGEALVCPPGTINRIVCRTLPDGSVSCVEQCVPFAAV